MNLSYKWLCELIDTGLSPEEMAERLTSAGCAVEEINPAAGDTQMVAEITSNRPDWLCHFGVARELSALTGKPVKYPDVAIQATSVDINETTKVTVHDAELCPRYTARLIKGVAVKDSPDWLKQKLEAVGLRPINNVVDITNYVLYEMNQPLHAFDFDLLEGGEVNVRRAISGETVKAIDGSDCKLKSDMLVIADAKKPVAVAGVMGGMDSEVTGKTVNVLLESAYFEPRQVRRTSRALKLLSDSSYRFERSIDMGAVECASQRACQLILELAGGELCEGIIDTNPDAGKPVEVTMRYARCNRILGCEMKPEEVKQVFDGLGLKTIKDDAETITVEVPTFRGDLYREADLIEEVARLVGYGRVPDKVTMRVAHLQNSPLSTATQIVRNTLAGAGYHECVTDPFVPQKWQDNENATRIMNPVDSGRPVMRKSLVPSLLEVCRVNRLAPKWDFFELNRVYQENPRSETLRLCMIDSRGMEYVRGALEAALAALRISGDKKVGVAAAQAAGYVDGSAAELSVNGQKVGVMGLVDPKICKAHDLDKPVAALEIDFAVIAELPRTDRVAKALPKFPGIRRDLALVVAEDVQWTKIEGVVVKEQGITPALESVYRGKGLQPGEKSVAFTFTYYNEERSLTDEEANGMRDALLAALQKEIPGAHLR